MKEKLLEFISKYPELPIKVLNPEHDTDASIMGEIISVKIAEYCIYNKATYFKDSKMEVLKKHTFHGMR